MAHRASCERPNLLLADLCCQRVPATESIAVAMVEGQIVRIDDLHGDSRPQGCAQSLPPLLSQGQALQVVSRGMGAMNMCPLAAQIRPERIWTLEECP